MDTTYRLVNLTARERGDTMYTTGQTAATPDLARLVPGHLIRRSDDRLGIEQADWADDESRSRNTPPTGRHVTNLVLIEAESSPGEWGIR